MDTVLTLLGTTVFVFAVQKLLEHLFNNIKDKKKNKKYKR